LEQSLEEKFEGLAERFRETMKEELRREIRDDITAELDHTIPKAAARVIREEIAAMARELDEDEY
jgi:hypothetical protein